MVDSDSTPSRHHSSSEDTHINSSMPEKNNYNTGVLVSTNAEDERELTAMIEDLDEYVSTLRSTHRTSNGKISLEELSHRPATMLNAISFMNKIRIKVGSAKGTHKSDEDGIDSLSGSRHTEAASVTANKGDDLVEDQAGETNDIPTYPEGYNEHAVKTMVAYTTAAYCKLHNTSVLECGCDVCVPEFFTTTLRVSHPDYDSSGFVGVQKADSDAEVDSCAYRNLIVASFRGTQTVTNWKNNLKAVYVSAHKEGFGEEARGSKIHMGFWETYKSIHNEVISEIVKLKNENPTYEVFVTGHSLGGAMATYCTLMVAMKGIEVQGYTFGQPRVGNTAFKKLFNSKVKNYYRIVNNYDLVPHLPARVMGFHHVGQELWFTSGLSAKERARVKLRTGHNHDVHSDPITLCQLKSIKQDKAPLHSLTIVDHIVYYERVTGSIRLQGMTTPINPVKKGDSRVVLVSDTVMAFCLNPNHNVVLMTYSGKGSSYPTPRHTASENADHKQTEPSGAPKEEVSAHTSKKISKRNSKGFISMLKGLSSMGSFGGDTKIIREAKTQLKKLALEYQGNESVLVAQIDVSKNEIPFGKSEDNPTFWFFPAGAAANICKPTLMPSSTAVPSDTDLIEFLKQNATSPENVDPISNSKFCPLQRKIPMASAQSPHDLTE
eukprot:CFRG0229T1